MKKILTKAGILLLVFILGVIGFSSLMNKETTDNKMDLEEATLPVMSMKIGGEKANLMLWTLLGRLQVDFMREKSDTVRDRQGTHSQHYTKRS